MKTHLQDGCITLIIHTKRLLYAVVVCHLVITIDPEHVAKCYFRFISHIAENSLFRYEIGNLEEHKQTTGNQRTSICPVKPVL